MTPDLRSLNARLTEIEQRSIELTGHTRAVGTLPAAGSPLNHKAADAVVQAIDERFTEIGGQIDRRLAELEVKVKIELGALDAQDHALAAGVETRLEGLRGEIGEAIATERRGIDADMRALRAQMAAVHKDFAGTLARLVDEQITKTVATRLQALEEQLRETVREEARLSGQDQQIAELRQRVESQEGNLLSLVMALGQSCLQAAERIPPPAPPAAAPPPPPASGGAGGAAVPTEIRVAPAADPDLPGFARAREHKPLWRIPMVSCFLFATGSLLALHYL
jgi:DNA anti-recombination protein RmuC